MNEIRITAESTPERVDAAALVWAAATAARDGETQVPSLELARPVLAAVLGEAPGARLLSALDEERTVGFLLSSHPAPGGAFVDYFGVDPAVWGQGVGSLLLRTFERSLRADGVARAELWVYRENRAATELYQRLGWRTDGAEQVNERSGRMMVRYVLDIAA